MKHSLHDVDPEFAEAAGVLKLDIRNARPFPGMQGSGGRVRKRRQQCFFLAPDRQMLYFFGVARVDGKSLLPKLPF